MTEEYKEFKQYVQDHNIVEMKKQELKNMLDKHELEAMKLIYCSVNIPDDDAIKKLADKQLKESRKLKICSPADVLLTFQDPSLVLKEYFCHSA